MVGDIAEEKDAERRSSRESEKEEGRRVLEPLDAIAALLDEVDTAARSAVRCALEGAGLHQHHRGEWRRRRGEAVNAYKAKPVVGEIRLTA